MAQMVFDSQKGLAHKTWEWPGWEPPLKPLGLCYKMEHWHVLPFRNSGNESNLLEILSLECH